jgi:methyltransferase (TIGR00027 family)
MKPSQTAQFAAAHRAYHCLHDPAPVFQDEPAIWLLSPPLSTVLKVAPLRWLFWRPLLAKVGPISAFVVIRSRYAEDALADQVGSGCHQYVILGAGLDSWALRHAETDVSVFEVDRRATQEWKEARIRSRLGALPPHLVLVPADLEHEAAAEVLPEAGFDRRARAFVSWLGTICYLTPHAIEEVLRSLAGLCAPGSRIAFDYFERKATMSASDRELFELLDKGGTRRGEPIRTLLGAGDLAEIVRSAGLEVVEDLSASEIRARYLADRSDELDVPGFGRLCCVESPCAG